MTLSRNDRLIKVNNKGEPITTGETQIRWRVDGLTVAFLGESPPEAVERFINRTTHGFQGDINRPEQGEVYQVVLLKKLK